MSNNEPININAESFEAAVTKSPVPVIVDFWANWCPPCKMLSPVLDEIAREKEGAVRVAKVDADENRDLLNRFGIRSLPTLLFFNKGELKDTVIGATGKRDIVSRIDALTATA